MQRKTHTDLLGPISIEAIPTGHYEGTHNMTANWEPIDDLSRGVSTMVNNLPSDLMPNNAGAGEWELTLENMEIGMAAMMRPLVLMRSSPALGRGMRKSSRVRGRPGSQNTAPRMKLGPPATWYPGEDAGSGSDEKGRRNAPPIRRRMGSAA
ncbi:Os08g0109250, partial [Oryza sativa Japonica Group]